MFSLKRECLIGKYNVQFEKGMLSLCLNKHKAIKMHGELKDNSIFY